MRYVNPLTYLVTYLDHQSGRYSQYTEQSEGARTSVVMSWLAPLARR